MDREHTVAHLIENIYQAATDSSLWPRFLDQFADFFNSSGIALFVQDFDEGRGTANSLGFAATARMDTAFLKSFDEHYSAVNPWVEKMKRMTPGVPVSDVVLFPREKLPRTEWFADWLRPQDFGAGMGVSLAKVDGLALHLTLHRPASIGDYSDEELRSFQSFASHIQRAIALHAKLSEFEQWKAGSVGAIERLRVGVIFLDSRARVVFANQAARKVLDCGHAIRIERDARIGATRASDARRVQSAISSAVDPRTNAARSSFRVRIQSSAIGSPTDLTVLPLPRRPAGLPSRLLGEGPAAVMFITDPDRQIDVPCAALIEQYGFTPAEALLAQALVNGRTLDQYASSRGITRNTVMTQLKAVMAKTGKTRQVDVVSAILTGPVWLLSGL